MPPAFLSKTLSYKTSKCLFRANSSVQFACKYFVYVRLLCKYSMQRSHPTGNYKLLGVPARKNTGEAWKVTRKACNIHLGPVHFTVCWVLNEGRVSLQPLLIFPNWHEPSNSSIAGHVPPGVPSLRTLEVTGCGSCGSSDLARLKRGHDAGGHAVPSMGKPGPGARRDIERPRGRQADEGY